MTNPKQPFLPQFLPLALRAAFDYVNTPTKIQSKSIRLSMTPEIDAPLRGRLNVPYYWAEWYHNGRSAINLNGSDKGPMVYFRDPKKDPRIKGGYPVSASDVKPLRLSSSQYWRLRDSGELIATMRVGPTRPHPFFADSGGMAGFPQELDKIAKAETDKYVTAKLQAAGLLNKKVSIKI